LGGWSTGSFLESTALSVTAWRIVKQKYPAAQAFDGEGARLYGGRWNSRGVSVVYAAGSQSLAVLEMLVHLDAADLLQSYVLFEVKIDAALMSALVEADLPLGWRSNPPPPGLREMGDIWAASHASVALRVPSSLIPEEYNYLLNPKHPEFGKLEFGHATPFRYDARLAERK
jgi:RES domain-containing protein